MSYITEEVVNYVNSTKQQIEDLQRILGVSEDEISQINFKLGYNEVAISQYYDKLKEIMNILQAYAKLVRIRDNSIISIQNALDSLEDLDKAKTVHALLSLKSSSIQSIMLLQQLRKILGYPAHFSLRVERPSLIASYINESIIDFDQLSALFKALDFSKNFDYEETQVMTSNTTVNLLFNDLPTLNQFWLHLQVTFQQQKSKPFQMALFSYNDFVLFQQQELVQETSFRQVQRQAKTFNQQVLMVPRQPGIQTHSKNEKRIPKANFKLMKQSLQLESEKERKVRIQKLLQNSEVVEMKESTNAKIKIQNKTKQIQQMDAKLGKHLIEDFEQIFSATKENTHKTKQNETKDDFDIIFTEQDFKSQASKKLLHSSQMRAKSQLVGDNDVVFTKEDFKTPMSQKLIAKPLRDEEFIPMSIISSTKSNLRQSLRQSDIDVEPQVLEQAPPLEEIRKPRPQTAKGKQQQNTQNIVEKEISLDKVQSIVKQQQQVSNKPASAVTNKTKTQNSDVKQTTQTQAYQKPKLNTSALVGRMSAPLSVAPQQQQQKQANIKTTTQPVQQKQSQNQNLSASQPQSQKVVNKPVQQQQSVQQVKPSPKPVQNNQSQVLSNSQLSRQNLQKQQPDLEKQYIDTLVKQPLMSKSQNNLNERDDVDFLKMLSGLEQEIETFELLNDPEAVISQLQQDLKIPLIERDYATYMLGNSFELKRAYILRLKIIQKLLQKYKYLKLQRADSVLALTEMIENNDKDQEEICKNLLIMRQNTHKQFAIISQFQNILQCPLSPDFNTNPVLKDLINDFNDQIVFFACKVLNVPVQDKMETLKYIQNERQYLALNLEAEDVFPGVFWRIVEEIVPVKANLFKMDGNVCVQLLQSESANLNKLKQFIKSCVENKQQLCKIRVKHEGIEVFKSGGVWEVIEDSDNDGDIFCARENDSVVHLTE
ncbi:Conserved_hypothetical protein [Hexamita inflata]|uniref:Uncharacterized protein n=1 Tax=Hexamita inflata TaxID=28002 RepID=A0AA86PJ71_9EUKA|nr:Conserved hypothetical protein [Hexamita inflata]